MTEVMAKVLVLRVTVVLLCGSQSLAALEPSARENGYPIDGLGDFEPARSPEVLKCPTDNLITSKHKCKVGADWVDCTRKYCCPDYIYISGRCVPQETDPCSLGLCEHKCNTYLQRLICTCFDGYVLNSYNQKHGIKPFCEDINECLDNNGDCEQKCTNTVGSHFCECDVGYTLNIDNRTCDLDKKESDITSPSLAATRERCYANCEAMNRLQERVRSLHEHVAALGTAVRLSSFASGPPGPPGPPGAPGAPGTNVDGQKTENDGEDFSYNLLDSYVNTPNGAFKCQRGPVGPPGAAGMEGPKGSMGSKGSRGPRGQRGSFDFLLLLLADLRHDIINLENKVYPKGESPPKFNIQHAWKRQQMKENAKRSKEGHALEAYSPPIIEQTGVKITNNGESGEIERDHTKTKIKGDQGDAEYSQQLDFLILKQTVIESMKNKQMKQNPDASNIYDLSAEDFNEEDNDDPDYEELDEDH